MAVVILSKGLVALLTLPGVIIYGWEKRYLTEYMRKQIYPGESRYVMPGMDDQAGHEGPRNREWILITPVFIFILNSIISMALFVVTYINFPHTNILQAFAFWLGFSLAVQSFPDDKDADCIWEWYGKSWKSSIRTMISYPAAIIISTVKIHWLAPVFYAGIILIIIKWIVTGTFT